MEERESRGGGGAAGVKETLGVTQASRTPRPLGCGWKETREAARRRRAVGMGTLGWGWEQAGAARLGEPDVAPQIFPLFSKAGGLGVMDKREGKLRHGLAETLLSWPIPFHSPGASLSRAPFFRAPHLNPPSREIAVPETPPQPLTRAVVWPSGPPPAQSHLGQQDEELFLAKGLGAAGTHAPLRRHRPAAPGLSDLPLLPDQATGQRCHGAPGGDTPKPAGARSVLDSPERPAHHHGMLSTLFPTPPHPQDLRISLSTPLQPSAPTLEPRG